MKLKFNYLVIAALTLAFLPINAVRAAAVSSFSDQLSTIKESVAANHTLTFTINDSWDASETITIDFPDTFSTTGFANSDALDYDIADDGVDKTVVAAGACSANNVEINTVNTTTDTFTFTLCSGSTSVASASVMTIEIGTHATTGGTGNTQITNQTAAQNNTDAIVTLGGTFGGTGSLALEIVADNDVAVDATVEASITCTFTGSMTASFTGTEALSTGAVETAAQTTTITVSTNAGGGANVKVYDAGNGTNPGLYKSSGTTYLIGSADSSYSDLATLAAGTDGFGIKASEGGGTGTNLAVDGRFDASGGANEVGGLEVGAGSAVTLASGGGAMANQPITISYMAAVSGLAPAGTYNDTVTFVCTGVF